MTTSHKEQLDFSSLLHHFILIKMVSIISEYLPLIRQSQMNEALNHFKIINLNVNFPYSKKFTILILKQPLLCTLTIAL